MADETEAERKARAAADAAAIEQKIADGVAAALKARADADGGEKLDTILEHLRIDGEHRKRMDARMDAFEKKLEEKDSAKKDEDAAMADARRKADAARMDAEREEWMKDDAETCARDDAEEETERKAMEEKGEPKEIAADKARKARKDRMKARRDAAEEKAKADAARADAAATIKAAVDAAIKARMPADDTDEDRKEKAQIQARSDASYQGFGQRAAAPMPGETVRDYRVRMLDGLKQHSKAWKDVDLGLLPGTSINIADEQIRADAAVAARNPTDIPAGQLRELRRVDPDTNLARTEFVGPHTFIRSMNRAPQFLTGKFNTGRAN